MKRIFTILTAVAVVSLAACSSSTESTEAVVEEAPAVVEATAVADTPPPAPVDATKKP